MPISDGFTGDGNLNGRTTESGGATWTAPSVFTTSGGRAVRSGTAGWTNAPARVPGGTASGLVEANVFDTSGNNLIGGVLGRHTDDNNYYFAYVAVGTTSLVIGKWVGGSFGQLGATVTLGSTFVSGDKIGLRIEGTSPATLTAYVNGSQVATRTDSSLTTGSNWGILNYGAATIGHDGFAFTEATATTHQVAATGKAQTSGSAAAVRLLAGTASGAAQTSGSAAATRRLAGQATGGSTTSGSASATVPARQGAASGLAATSGSAAATVLRQATASGLAQTAGAAAATALRQATATGLAQTSGSASVGGVQAAGASGTAQTSGSALAARLLAGTATGAAQTAGSAAAVRGLGASATGASTTSGSASAAAVREKVGQLVDPFEGNSIDLLKWQLVGAPTQGGGVLHVPGASGVLTGVRSLARRDLVGSQAVAAVAQAIPGTGGLTETLLRLESPAGDRLEVAKFQSLLRLRMVVGGSTTTTSVTYSATAHRWWRIAALGSLVLWETSPDGATWTTQRSDFATFDLSALTVFLGVQPDGAVAGEAQFDSFNQVGQVRLNPDAQVAQATTGVRLNPDAQVVGASVGAAGATGRSTTSGSAKALVPYRMARAVGAAITAGSASALQRRMATARGTAQTSGSAAATVQRQTSATGRSATTGRAAAGLRVLASATGSSTTSGSALPTATYAPTATGLAQTSGSASAAAQFAISASGLAQTSGMAYAYRSGESGARGLAQTSGSASALTPQRVGGAIGVAITGGSASAVRLLAGAATGTALTGGRASAALVVVMAASGVAQTFGQATAFAGLVTSASGRAATTGSARAAIVHAVQAVGLVVTSGQASAEGLQQARATGRSTTSGVASAFTQAHDWVAVRSEGVVASGVDVHSGGAGSVLVSSRAT